MTEVTRHEPGSFSWAELATSDPPSAKSFYTALFGWTAAELPMGPEPEEVYTRFQIGGKDVADLYRMMPEQAVRGVPPNWLCYVRRERGRVRAEGPRARRDRPRGTLRRHGLRPHGDAAGS